jgi:hypothetical protein
MLATAPRLRKNTDPANAGLIAIQREQARRHLLDFAVQMNPKYQRTAAHELIASKLELVEKYIVSGGKEGIGRLMIFMPPRHGKTELSKLFQAWFLGRNPDMRVITTSYSADLANDNSRAVRDLVAGKPYAGVFGILRSAQNDMPVELSDDARSVSAWSLKEPHKGGMLAAGVGGGITGRGAHLLNIDDPFKNRDEASSESHRKRVLSWYRSVAYTRLEFGGAVVLINTRWDQEDLSGELLRHMVSDELGDSWDVVFLPAFALETNLYPENEDEFRENLLRGIYIPIGGDQIGRTVGTALWPSKYDAARLEIIRSNTLDFEFSAQYQQMPRLAEGNFFDDRDFVIVERAPENLKWVRYVDLAKGQNTGNDFNCTYAVAFDAEGDLYIRDPLKERNIDEFLPQCKMLMLDDRELGTMWGIEDVAFQFLVVRDFLSDPRLANIEIMGLPVKGSKEDRARAWRLRAKQGKVKLVRGLWNLDFIRIASAFPNGRHDDDVDSVSGGVEMIAGNGVNQRTVSSPAIVVSAESLFAGVSY